MTSTTAVGANCLEMCPTSERSRREKDRLLHRFEIIIMQGSTCSRPKSSWKADSKKCVKEFSRAAAGQAVQKSSELRPPSVLKKTVAYLFQSILHEKHDVEPFDALYDFVFDRLRAVRQDMVVQHACDEDCVHVLECIVRFHIYSIFRLCEEPISVFDAHINGVHLLECLKRLLVCYSDGVRSKKRAEIEAYYLLYNLGSCDAMRHALTLPKHLIQVGVLALAFQLNLAWLNCNFYRAMRLIQDLPFLHCVAVMQHVPSIRRSAMRIMSHGFSAKNCRFPVALLKQMLAFDDDADTRRTCNYYGIQLDQQFAVFYKPAFADDQIQMPLKRYQFINEKHKNINLVDILKGEAKGA